MTSVPQNKAMPILTVPTNWGGFTDMAINPQAREAVLRQMSEVPELRGGLAQMAGRSSMTQNLAAELQRLNPKGYNRRRWRGAGARVVVDVIHER